MPPLIATAAAEFKLSGLEVPAEGSSSMTILAVLVDVFMVFSRKSCV
jgi:hypothetical protein